MTRAKFTIRRPRAFIGKVESATTYVPAHLE
eukprot:SAG22_NODE_18027_length_294_cov_1.061538_1_plen_30_part_01